ncbi:TPA: hypothetical protein DCG61_01400 [Patescibacteria group bacterium]|nr:hypothetical protein [Patescibacteria group bacterium]
MSRDSLKVRIDEISKLTGVGDLRSYLRQNFVVEDNLLDFKRDRPTDPKKIRKVLCSFANCRGGIVFFGIDDSKQIYGVPENSEFLTLLNRDIGTVKPQLRVGTVEILKTFKVRGQAKYVHCVLIKPSLSIDKPHVCDSLIYIRSNGESLVVESGVQLRREFFSSGFDPGHISQIEHELNLLKDFAVNTSHLSVIYFRALQKSLRDRHQELVDSGHNTGQVDSCLSWTQNIEIKINQIQSSSIPNYSATGLPAAQTNIVVLTRELANSIDEFILSYKRLNNL